MATELLPARMLHCLLVAGRGIAWLRAIGRFAGGRSPNVEEWAFGRFVIAIVMSHIARWLSSRCSSQAESSSTSWCVDAQPGNCAPTTPPPHQVTRTA